MKRIAYIRVSTNEQRPDRQIDGVGKISDELHVEVLSAVAKFRPVYEKVIADLGSGDTLVVWSLDRAFRSARDALNELHKLQCRGVQFHIADLNLDTATPHGKLTFTLMSAVAEFERDVLVQRTKEGIAAARARGKRIGRPPKLNDCQIRLADYRVNIRGETLQEVADDCGVTRWTVVSQFENFSDSRPCRQLPPIPICLGVSMEAEQWLFMKASSTAPKAVGTFI